MSNTNTETKKGKKPFVPPVCKKHTDCFANKNGGCICLKNNKFKGTDCPFYKPAKDVPDYPYRDMEMEDDVDE